MNELDREIIERLKDSSLRLTGQRLTMLSLLLENRDKHLNAEEIHGLLMEGGAKVGIATVYRTLSMLEKLKLITRIHLDDGSIRYQVSSSGRGHEHHHLICRKCGQVTDMEDDLLEDMEKRIENIYDFKVLDHKLKFYGICSRCKTRKD